MADSTTAKFDLFAELRAIIRGQACQAAYEIVCTLLDGGLASETPSLMEEVEEALRPWPFEFRVVTTTWSEVSYLVNRR
jgi:hypothetical protein